MRTTSLSTSATIAPIEHAGGLCDEEGSAPGGSARAQRGTGDISAFSVVAVSLKKNQRPASNHKAGRANGTVRARRLSSGAVRVSSSNGAAMALSAPPEFTSPLGRPVPRTEDRPLLTGQGRYVADLGLTGAAQVVFVNSPIAHARIASVDVSAARAAPGVLAVVTAADLGLEPTPPMPVHDQRMVRPWLADGVVRYVGEPVVALVATEQALAVDAAELVEVDYDPLEAVVALREAATDQVLLFPEAGTNTCARLEGTEDPTLFDDCEVVVELSMAHPRLAACPVEPRCAAAAWSDDGRGGRLTCWAATQAPHRLRANLAGALGIDPAEVRRRNLIPPDGFPSTTPTGPVYDPGDYQALLHSVMEAGGYG